MSITCYFDSWWCDVVSSLAGQWRWKFKKKTSSRKKLHSKLERKRVLMRIGHKYSSFQKKKTS